ncbi:MAG: NADPH-dependent F420 reductase [Halobacteriaceae archaeon]
MRISLLGGTGDIGEALALRWAFHSNHDILIGSRSPERARNKATEYETELDSRGVDRTINGFVNEMAADRGDVIVVSVPAAHIKDTITEVRERLDQDDIVITPAVAMNQTDNGFQYEKPKDGSVTQIVSATVPEGIPVIGAYHNLSADRLANLDVELDLDTILVGDDRDAKETVKMLTEKIDGLRALDGGPLSNAAEVEALTPLLINLAMHNKNMHDVGVKFH